MVIERLPEVESLSVAEKWVLVDELWASLIGAETDVQADPAIVAELERRMTEYEAHPETAVSWEALRDRLVARK